MHESQLLRDLLIHIFPQLTPQDFPHIHLEQHGDAWFEQWLQESDLAPQYILECDYRDWANAFDLKLNFLNITNSKPILIDPILDEIYEFFETLEQQFEELEPKDLDSTIFELNDEQIEQQEVCYFESNEDMLDATIVIVENLLNAILRTGFNVIAILHPHKFQFILSQAGNQPLEDLTLLLQEAFSAPQVRFFSADTYSHHQFSYLIGKLL